MEKLFPIAKITQVKGVKGEVGVRPLTRYFADCIDKRPLLLGFSEQLAREVELQATKGTGKRVCFQFAGFQSREEAETLLGQTLYVPIYQDDILAFVAPGLIGYSMRTTFGQWIGELTDILWLPANDVYVIQTGKREILIPIIPEIVNYIDHGDESIVITPMEGLLD